MNARFVNYQMLPSLGLFVTEVFFLNEKTKREKKLITTGIIKISP